MTVKDVKKDVDDVTMAIPLNILQVLGGDFDGSNIEKNYRIFHELS